jgi:predicted pyridoxine 5'-phosphate oxidase superfamily flavin-nucleotide-binding protein
VPPDDAKPPDGVAPFHVGEIAMQERSGVREPMARVGRALIRHAMPPEHQELFARLPMLLVGSIDAGRRPWASILVGRPGFVHAEDARTLRVDARPSLDDPLANALAVGAPLGLLGIELATRRRNRMNGTVVALDELGFTVAVDQSFGNCPQYIQARAPVWRRATASAATRPAETIGDRLDDATHAIVTRADTLFVASAAAAARGHAGPDGVDVSHRGGKPGFVKIRAAQADGPTVLVIPDFRGNYMFNTLGNVAVNPRLGLVIPDFERGDVVQLIGRADIVWEGAELASFTGAERLLVVTLEAGVRHRDALPFTWSAPEPARQLRDTGAWPAPAS